MSVAPESCDLFLRVASQQVLAAVATQVTGISDLGEIVGYWNKTLGSENFKAIPATDLRP